MRSIDSATDELSKRITNTIEYVQEKERSLAALFVKRGFNFLRLSKPEEAAQDFDLGITLDAACGIGHLGLGIARISIQETRPQGIKALSLAIKKLTAELSQDPNQTTLIFRRAQARRFLALVCPVKTTLFEWRLQSRNSILGEALADVERLLLNPHSRIDALAERGLVRVAQDNFAQAREDFDTAMSNERASTFSRSLLLAVRLTLQVIT